MAKDIGDCILKAFKEANTFWGSLSEEKKKEYIAREKATEELKNVRKKRNLEAIKTYTPLHTDKDYLDYIEDNGGSFDKLHYQNDNHSEYLSYFSCASQHTYGDCVRECLDRAIEISIEGGN